MKKNRKYIRKIKSLAAIMILACLLYPQTVHAGEEDAVAAAKKGIVEVFSGFSDGNGTFHRMKSGSGFLISNGAEGVYIVTNYSILHNSDEEKRAYCESNAMEAENLQMSDSIRIVVKDDVTVESSVLARSEEWDFCILAVEPVMNEKVPLKLGDNGHISTGDVIYALGYPDNSKNLEFSVADVEIFQGNIQDRESSQSGKQYIQHSAPVSDGNTGGPLLDEDGYVIGINCKEYSDVSSGRYFSLPINEVTEVLDSFAKDYGSRKKDELKETKKIQMVIYVLAGLILCLVTCLIIILILNRRDKKKAELEETGSQDKTIGLSFYQGSKHEVYEKGRKFSQRTTDLELIRIGNGQAVIMAKTEFIIGKSPEQADFFISDNKAVSRKHACISWKNDEYGICDLGSVNGSYLRGERLAEGIMAKLSDGDLFMLADEKFQVKIHEKEKDKENDI